MGNELVKPSGAKEIAVSGQALPALAKQAGGAALFAREEFFYAEHHNPHTQKAYLRAVKAFLAWCEGKKLELPSITPGMVGQFLVASGVVRWKSGMGRDEAQRVGESEPGRGGMAGLDRATDQSKTISFSSSSTYL